jgi:DNA-binding response OmpR family regulator
VGDVVVDFLRYQATKAGAPLKKTRKEFGVLRLLAAKAGEVLTRDDLLNDVWGLENYPSTRTVDNHITSLRKMIDDPAAPSRIITIHGVGYRLLVKPE